MSLQGNTASFELSEILQLLQINNYSGTLRINRNHELAMLFLKESQIQLVPPSLLSLGEEEGPQKNFPEEEIYNLFTWKDAHFIFLRNYYPPELLEKSKENPFPAFDLNQIMMEAMRRADEWEVLARDLHSSQIILIREEKGSSQTLSSGEKEILSHFDGRRSCREIEKALEIKKFPFYTEIHRLYKLSLLRALTAEEAAQGCRESLEKGDLLQALNFIEMLSLLPRPSQSHLEELLKKVLSHPQFGTQRGISLYLQKQNLALLMGKILDSSWEGSLIISHENRRKCFHFTPGEIRVFDSAPQDYLRLGQVLFRQGKISRAQIDYCLTIHKLGERKEPLGQIMEEEEFITGEDILEVLWEKLEEDLSETLLWNGPYISFKPHHFPQLPGKTTIHYRCQKRESRSRILREKISQWEEMFHLISSGSRIFIPHLEEKLPHLEQRELEILHLVNGWRNVRDIIRLSHRSQIEVCLELEKLFRQEIIRPLKASELAEKREEALGEEKWQLAEKLARAGAEEGDRKAEKIWRELREEKKLPSSQPGENLLKGDLYTFPAPDLYQLLSYNRRSGTLHLWKEKIHLQLFFDKGNFYTLELENPFQWQREDQPRFKKRSREEVHQEILESFHWMTARFQFEDHIFPEYVHWEGAEEKKNYFETQHLLLESFKQMEALQRHGSAIPGIEALVRRSEKLFGALDDSPLNLPPPGKTITILQLYQQREITNLESFLLEVGRLLKSGWLKLVTSEEAWLQLLNRNSLSLREIRHLYQHLALIDPDPEVEEKMLEFLLVDQVRQKKRENSFPQALELSDILALLRHLQTEDTFGTMISLTKTGRVATYLSPREIWLCYLDSDADFADLWEEKGSQANTRSQAILKGAQKKNLFLDEALREELSQRLPREEKKVERMVRQKIYKDLLAQFQLPLERRTYHSELFPLQAYENQHRCLRLTGELSSLYHQIEKTLRA